MNKKLLSVITAAFLSAGALAGCSVGDGTASDVDYSSLLSNGVEKVTKFYTGYADIVAEYGDAEQQETFNVAKLQLDSISESVNEELSEDELVEYMLALGEIQGQFISAGSAAYLNSPDEASDDTDADSDTADDALTDALESTATLLGGIVDNVDQNGSEYQKNLLSGYQDEFNGYANEVTAGVDADRAAQIEFGLKLIDSAAKSINDSVNEGAVVSADVDLDALNDEVENLVMQVNGTAEGILSGDDEVKKAFVTKLTDEIQAVGDKMSSGDVTAETAKEITDELGVISAMLKVFGE